MNLRILGVVWTLALCGLAVALYLGTRDVALDDAREDVTLQDIVAGRYGPPTQCGTVLSQRPVGPRSSRAKCEDALADSRELVLLVGGISLIVGLGGTFVAANGPRDVSSRRTDIPMSDSAESDMKAAPETGTEKV